ncbi:MAG TPA: hypothetical protein VFE24_14525 [Pirellulales bacterium]|nr:hypothetical protein [Pirellulales bacterium]
MKTSTRWTCVAMLLANLFVWSVFALRQPQAAADQKTTEPFANSIEQRQEIINQLKELNDQLKEQNALLKSGHLQVVVAK